MVDIKTGSISERNYLTELKYFRTLRSISLVMLVVSIECNISKIMLTCFQWKSYARS